MPATTGQDYKPAPTENQQTPGHQYARMGMRPRGGVAMVVSLERSNVEAILATGVVVGHNRGRASHLKHRGQCRGEPMIGAP